MNRDGTGILCPLCGCDTEVIETRRNLKSLRRRRKCRNVACTGKVTTVELALPNKRATERTTDFALMPRTAVVGVVRALRDLGQMEEP